MYHPFLGGVDVTLCLGDETVTQHCRVRDTDAFDIVIGEAVWGASPIPAAQPVALFARPDQEFSCRCYGILISVGFL